MSRNEKKLNLQLYQNVIRWHETQLIERAHFPDRHFWHEGYDKALASTLVPQIEQENVGIEDSLAGVQNGSGWSH
jgi:hypothetical protein